MAGELARWHGSTLPEKHIPHRAEFFDIMRRWAVLGTLRQSGNCCSDLGAKLLCSDSGHFELDLLGKMTISVQGLTNEVRRQVLESPAV